MTTKAETFRRRRVDTLTPGERELYDIAMETFLRVKNVEGMSDEEALAACDKVITEGLPEVEAEDDRMGEWLSGASSKGGAEKAGRRSDVPGDGDDAAD